MLYVFAVQDIGVQLSNFVKAVMETHAECRDAISGANGLFPIDIDLEQVCYHNSIIITIISSHLNDYSIIVITTTLNIIMLFTSKASLIFLHL